MIAVRFGIEPVPQALAAAADILPPSTWIVLRLDAYKYLSMGRDRRTGRRPPPATPSATFFLYGFGWIWQTRATLNCCTNDLILLQPFQAWTRSALYHVRKTRRPMGRWRQALWKRTQRPYIVTPSPQRRLRGPLRCRQVCQSSTCPKPSSSASTDAAVTAYAVRTVGPAYIPTK